MLSESSFLWGDVPHFYKNLLFYIFVPPYPGSFGGQRAAQPVLSAQNSATSDTVGVQERVEQKLKCEHFAKCFPIIRNFLQKLYDNIKKDVCRNFPNLISFLLFETIWNTPTLPQVGVKTSLIKGQVKTFILQLQINFCQHFSLLRIHFMLEKILWCIFLETICIT